MKKAALAVVGAATAAVLALSPLAFAGEDHAAIDKNSSGAVSGLNGNNVNTPFQACNNNYSGAGLQGNDLTGAIAGNAQADNSDRCKQGAAAGDSVEGHHGTAIDKGSEGVFGSAGNGNNVNPEFQGCNNNGNGPFSGQLNDATGAGLLGNAQADNSDKCKQHAVAGDGVS